MTLKEHFAKAEREESKIPKEYIDKLTGLSSPKCWHLLNNLCAESDTYFEIGTYMGSSLMAALYGNDHVKAVAVDNFCMKPNTRKHFFHNVKDLKFDFIEKDCFQINPATIGPFSLYFYDGEHSRDSQYKAITHFIPAMKDEFIFVVDDWNQDDVKNGTLEALKDSGLLIVDFEDRRNKLLKDKSGWWCGIAAFKLKKP